MVRDTDTALPVAVVDAIFRGSHELSSLRRREQAEQEAEKRLDDDAWEQVWMPWKLAIVRNDLTPWINWAEADHREKAKGAAGRCQHRFHIHRLNVTLECPGCEPVAIQIVRSGDHLALEGGFFVPAVRRGFAGVAVAIAAAREAWLQKADAEKTASRKSA